MYKISYIDKFPESPRPQYSFGRSIHKAIELFHKHEPAPATLDDILRYLEENWVREGYATPEMDEEWKVLAQAILTDFIEDLSPGHRPPLAAERPFHVIISGIPMNGRIDAIERLADGQLEIVDYKSGENEPTEADVSRNEQLGIYQLAIEEDMASPVGRLTLYQLRHRKRISVPPLSEDAKAELRRSLVTTANLIRTSHFDPELNEGCPCDWPEHCPYFKDLYRGRGQTTLMQHDGRGPGQDEIDTIVHEYATLIDEGKGDNHRVVELENRMKRYCKDRDILRIHSGELVATMVYETEHSGEWYWRIDLEKRSDG